MYALSHTTDRETKTIQLSTSATPVNHLKLIPINPVFHKRLEPVQRELHTAAVDIQFSALCASAQLRSRVPNSTPDPRVSPSALTRKIHSGSRILIRGPLLANMTLLSWASIALSPHPVTCETKNCFAALAIISTNFPTVGCTRLTNDEKRVGSKWLAAAKLPAIWWLEWLQRKHSISRPRAGRKREVGRPQWYQNHFHMITERFSEVRKAFTLCPLSKAFEGDVWNLIWQYDGTKWNISARQSDKRPHPVAEICQGSSDSIDIRIIVDVPECTRNAVLVGAIGVKMLEQWGKVKPKDGKVVL
ncbi:hypothetical protein B0H13DRAFT_1850215 [Mycena leptocephala]|nr:hypothetical protein B0H13DRAFT_1850215 [Mycena leptocephala]